MLISKLQGGLGNQMFQYAAARGLCFDDCHVFLDHHFLEKNNVDSQYFTARKFELSIFKNLKATKASRFQINQLTSPTFFFRGSRLLFNIKAKHIYHHDSNYVPLSALPPGVSVYLDGYFQSEKYFKHIRTQLIDELTFPEFDTFNSDIEKVILKSPNAVSIHIRRGDYLKSAQVLSVHGVLPICYYQKALEMLKSNYDNLELFIFSDDIEWAKDKFLGYKTHFFDHNKGENSWKDMALMKLCKHNIVANSSFSWWAAWLSQTDGSKFAPTAWFNALSMSFNASDIIPNNWVTLKC